MSDQQPADEAVTRQSVDGLRDAVNDLRDSVDDERDARVREQELLARKQLTAAAAIEEAQKASGEAKGASRWAKRASIAAVVAVLIVALGAIVTRHQIIEDRVRNAIVACENANTSRKALVDYTNERVDKRINSVLDVAFAYNGVTNPTPDQQALREAAKEKIKADFAAEPAPIPDVLGPRDCSRHAVTSPTTIAPGR